MEKTNLLCKQILPFVLGLFCCAHLLCQAPNLSFEHIREDEGFDQNSVLNVLQDTDGFIWIGTPYGLYKYDGRNFKVYRNDPADANSLINNSVYELELDASGNILVGTGRGLTRFDRRGQTFSVYPRILKDARISAIYPEEDGSLWVGTLNSGLYHFKASDEFGEFPTHYYHHPNVTSSINSNQIHSITKDTGGNLWVGTVSGLNKMVGTDSEKKFVHFDAFNESVKSLFLDKKGRLWMGQKGLKLIAIENPAAFSRKDQQDYRVYSFDTQQEDKPEYGGLIAITDAPNDKLWIGIHGYGLYWLDPDTEQYHLYAPKPFQPKSLSSSNVEVVVMDNTDVLWVGTEEGGLNRSDLKRNDITFLTKNDFSENSLSNSSVKAILQGEENSIWVGTEYGLNHIDFNQENYADPIFSHYFLDSGHLNSEVTYRQPIWSILKDKDNDYWLASEEGIFHMTVDPVTNRPRFRPTDLDEVIEVFSMLEDNEGNLWFGSMVDGLIKWKKRKIPGTNTFDFSDTKFFIPDTEDPFSISGKAITCLYKDQKGNVWVGTKQSGLNLIIPGSNEQSERFVSFQHSPDNPNTLNHNSILSIHEDNEGHYWIGTFGGGLNKMTFTGNGFDSPQFEHFGEAEGLASNVVYGILEDDHGKLWLSTDHGVSSFDPDTQVFWNLDKSDGLEGNTFRQNVCYRMEDGYLLFGGLRGLNVFHPDKIERKTSEAPIKLTGIRIKNEAVEVGKEYNDRVLLKQAIHTLGEEEVDFKHHENVLTFEFAALHYASPEKNKFIYKLEGFDESWQKPREAPYAHYTNLPPGSYTFMVKASANEGEWSTEPATMKFNIAYPFWQTGWAKLSYLILGICLFLGIKSFIKAKHKERTAIKVQKEIEKANQLKLEFFTNISHDFKTPLTLIVNPLEEILADGAYDPSIEPELNTMKRNANYLLRLVNQLIEFRKIEVGETKLVATESNIVHFVREIAFSFKAMALKKQIDLTFESQLYELDVWFDWDKLEKILNNLLSNAIKFTPNHGSIVVRLTNHKKKTQGGNMAEPRFSNFARIQVEDNGVGIPEDQLPFIFQRFYRVNKEQRSPKTSGSGIGLAIAKDLMDLHYGTIDVKSKEGIGTQFILDLPIGNTHLQPEEMTSFVVAEDDEQAKTDMILTPVENVPQKQAEESHDKTVLVVDDNEDIRRLVRKGMKKYKVYEAENGKQALQIILKKVPNIIISDVLMPQMDGIDLCQEVKSNVRVKHIPIILLTALSSVEHRIKGIESGADAYIPKPFKMELLSITVDKLIESREYMRQRFQTEEKLTPNDVVLDTLDKQFLDKVMEEMEKNMGNESYWIEQLAEDLNTSRSTLFRKLKRLTGQPPNDFMRMIRLQRAAQLLKQGESSISQVSYMVGFSDPNYFGKCFRKLFGEPPSRFLTKEEANP